MPTISMKVNGTWTDIMSYNTSTSSLIKPLAFGSGGSGQSDLKNITPSKGADATTLGVQVCRQWGPVVALYGEVTTPAVTSSWTNQQILASLPAAIQRAQGMAYQRDNRYILPVQIGAGSNTILELRGQGGAAWSSNSWSFGITYVAQVS